MSRKPTTHPPADQTDTSNSPGSPDLFNRKSDPTDRDEMAKYGITCVPVDYFHCGDFRYTNLADAIAQAKRGCSALAAVDKPKTNGR